MFRSICETAQFVKWAICLLASIIIADFVK